MKKLMFMLITMMITLVMGTTIISCNYLNDKVPQVTSPSDSLSIVEAIDQYHNPMYTDAAEFRAYVQDEVAYNEFVSICKYLHSNTIEAISTTCIKSYGHVDHVLFMQEFHDKESAYINVDKVNWKNDNIVLQSGPSGPEKTLILDSVTTTKEGV